MANEPFPSDFFEMKQPGDDDNRPSSPEAQQIPLNPTPPVPDPSPYIATFQAVEAHFIAMRAKAVVNLNTYLQHPAGIGEHPDIIAECIKLVEDIDHSESVIGTLRRAQA